MAHYDCEVLKNYLSNNASITLETTERSGRGIFATKRFGPNEVIFEETPLVSGPSQKLGQEGLKTSGRCLFCSGCSTSLTPIEVSGSFINSYHVIGKSF